MSIESHPVTEKVGKGPTLDRLLSQAALYYNAYTSWDETHDTAVAHSAMLPVLLARGRRASVEAMFQGAGIRGYRVID